MSTPVPPTESRGRTRKKLEEFSMTPSAIYSRKRENEMSPEEKEERNKALSAKRAKKRTENQDGLENVKAAREVSTTANAVRLRGFQKNRTTGKKVEDRKKRNER